ncbi:Uma2 family endonuclease [Kitasatospora sp. MAP5-34]|uniref:Uma2 family endonuclease n=1 Tax=Kitasatospora sp. MAP5-34 TaxID=3035102 RepID=UPI002473BE3B|nr:Uma2 family endonuclease [Kitasatospora sp. MAP5-34]MDH6577632.1 Uma2 family endonuclease [Kitasatospora sp. MAP5-34]
MTLAHPEQQMTSLRQTAELAEQATGFRVEIIRGVLMMSPSPRGAHAGTINRIYDQLRPAVPHHLEPFQMVSVAMPDDDSDYATPDLAVLPEAFGESDDWLADPADVELVVEVVSTSNSLKDTVTMVEWYAAAGLPVYLLVDPRNGTWLLYSDPEKGAYRTVLPGKYGEDITLPTLDGLTLTTDRLPRYGR